MCDKTQNLNETGSETFFRYQIFLRPVPRLFSVPNFFDSGSDTIKKLKNSRNRDVTLCLAAVVKVEEVERMESIVEKEASGEDEAVFVKKGNAGSFGGR